MRSPSVSVIVVSDYRAGEDKSWNDIRSTLAGLARQDYDGPVEYLLLENPEDLKHMPADVPETLTRVRVVPSAAPGSYGLKNAGIREASGELVGVLDADCVPHPDWLRNAVGSMLSHPDAFAVSGRTTYPGRSTLERCLGLLSRSYVDRGNAGTVRLLSTNNMMVRRAVFRDNPLPEDTGPFAFRLLTERLLRQGGKLYFEPSMRVVHDFEGWDMERDMRRGIGWTSIQMRLKDATLPGAGVIRTFGPASIPLFYVYRMVESAGRSVRLPHYFGLSWYHLPMLLGLAAVVHSYELPGMLSALAQRSAGRTVYR